MLAKLRRLVAAVVRGASSGAADGRPVAVTVKMRIGLSDDLQTHLEVSTAHGAAIHRCNLVSNLTCKDIAYNLSWMHKQHSGDAER